jgi:hypothetical protein
MNKGILFGLYVAGITIVVILIEFVTGIDRTDAAQYFGLLGMVFLAIGIWLAQKARKAEQGGTLTYGQGVGTGMMVALTAGFVSAVFMIVYLTWINPDLLDYIKTKVETEMMANPNMSDEQREAALGMTGFMLTPVGNAVQTFFGTALIGLVIALITSIFTKSKSTTITTEASAV